MLRILPPLLVLALWIWAFIDCLTTPEQEARHLPKVAWVIIVLLFPLVGSIAWLVAGRQRAARTAGGPSGARGGRPTAPDDDPEFLASLDKETPHKDARHHEDMLKRWEADLRRREEELRGRDEPEDGPRR
ncbi:PLD nuclease N-terminal domain-containing protein [Saccharothrix sp. ST-888]|uniref:PLD nuclease N-terminal domain-containing protein n=1 Tax=Saccharothrix sp. ST-888 TaxID=1427391 RepID=UPI0005ECE95C|nr:PLD nuclease N-terminal domain-containing protein [Saccharothrix sp. ST-888]KJK55739.1 membrane protein [Saccharothrix sp. ST-888]